MKQPTKEGMEERFDRQFPFAILDWKPGAENDGDGLATDKMKEIKAFIEKEISLALLEKAEEVKKLKWNLYGSNSLQNPAEAHEDGFNEAIDLVADIISKVK